MSFQSSDNAIDFDFEELNGMKIFSKSKSAFENHLMQCLKQPEWELRKWLKKTLTRAGFRIFEDGYKSDRCEKDKRYETVHNMIAIRGEKPLICLAAHTDVCRDHNHLNSSNLGFRGEEYFMMYGRHQDDDKNGKNCEIKGAHPQKVEPVIKEFFDREEKLRRVIQDKYCNVQVGGDDRVGIAVNTWIALNSGYDMGLIFFTDEEIGLKSARACEMPQLAEFETILEVDKGNTSATGLVNKISGEILASYEVSTRLLSAAYDCGLPRALITGYSTDIYAIKTKEKYKHLNCFNLVCGYWNSSGASPNEYIDIKEVKDTMKFVAAVVKDYYLNGKTKL